MEENFLIQSSNNCFPKLKRMDQCFNFLTLKLLWTIFIYPNLKVLEESEIYVSMEYLSFRKMER